MSTPSSSQSGGALLRGVVLSSGAVFINLLGGLVVGKIITNAPAIGEAGVGIYSMLIAAVEVLIVLNNLGMRVALPKLLGGAEAGEQRDLIRACLGFQLILSGAAALAVWLGGAVLARGPWAQSMPALAGAAPYLWFLAAMLVVATLRELLLSILAGLHRYWQRALGMGLLSVVLVVLTALVVWRLEGGLSWLLAAVLVAHAAATVFLHFMLPMGRLPGLQRRPYARGVRFALPLYLNSVFGIVFQQVDTLLVGFLAGPVQAAFFEFGAKRIARYSGGLLNAAMVPYLPSISQRIAAGDRAGARGLLDAAYDAMTLVGYLGLLFALLVREPLVALLTNERFVEGVHVLGPMMLATLLALQAGLMGHTLIALGRPGWIAVVNVGLVLISLALNAVLIPVLGILGAGVAALSAALFSNIAQTVLVWRFGLRLPWWHYLRAHVCLAAAMVLVYALGDTLAARALGLAMFVALAAVGGLLRADQVRSLLAALKRRAG